MYRTLYDEIRGICKETGYPGNWPTHDRCPCCAAASITFFFKKIDIAYWICEECKFVFVNPYPDNQVTDIIYNAPYYSAVRNHIEIPRALGKSEDVSQSMPDNLYFEIIDLVKRKKAVGKWLDVGGGIGIFLHHVQTKSSSYSLFLNESNIDSVKFARDFYRLNVLPVGPEQLLSDHQTFDIISMLAVLEHINKPYEFLAAYLKVLSENGLLVLTVPNYTRLNRLLSRQHSYVVIPPYHLNLFNAQNIQLLLKRLNGLGGIEIHFTGDAAFKIKHLARMSESEDLKIPTQENPHPEWIYRKKATATDEIRFRVWQWLRKLKEHKGYAFLDQNLFSALGKWDGTSLMNIIAQKIEGKK